MFIKERTTLLLIVIILLIGVSLNTMMLVESRDRIDLLTNKFSNELPNLEEFEKEIDRLIKKNKYKNQTNQTLKVEFLQEPYCLRTKDGKIDVVALFFPNLEVRAWRLKSSNYLEYRNRGPDIHGRVLFVLDGPVIELTNKSEIYFPTNFTLNDDGKILRFQVVKNLFILCNPSQKR